MPVVAHVSTFAPTQCGIATYVQALSDALTDVRSVSVPVFYPGEVPSRYPAIAIDEPRSYAIAADFLNGSEVSLVSLQHEFGIFGGHAGGMVVPFLRRLAIPIVTTLHTVTTDLDRRQRSILAEIVSLSTRVVVMTAGCKDLLVKDLGCDESRIVAIRHGVPTVQFAFPEEIRRGEFFSAGPFFVTSGHVRPSKGYHLLIGALAEVRRQLPTAKLLILGSPQRQFAGGRRYSVELRQLIERTALADQVLWLDEYLPWDSLISYIQMADVGVLPYTDRSQTSSGVLPLFLACGRPVVASDFSFARETAEVVPGVHLIPSHNVRALSGAMYRIVENPATLRTLMREAHSAMQTWSWRATAARYSAVYRAALN